VPDQHDRRTQLLVGGIEHGGEIVFCEAFLLPLAAVVDQQPVDQPGALIWAGGHQPRDRYPSLTGGGDRDHGRVTSAGPSPPFRRFYRLPGFVFEDDPGSLLPRRAFTRGQTSLTQVAIAASSRSTAR